MKTAVFGKLALLCGLVLCCPAGWAQNVKITPLGSHAGELCDRDRATIFEDPTGVRILYDAGHSVTGADDARLGDVHVVLLSHAHGDHMGDRKMKALEAGTCDKPETVSAAPHSTTAEIAAAKNSALIMISEMGAFIGKKVENIRGKPTGACPEAGGSHRAAAGWSVSRHRQPRGHARRQDCECRPRSGDHDRARSAREHRCARAAYGSDEGRGHAGQPSRFARTPSGYVIRFTNGLTVYLSGDTAMHTEMKTVVHDFYKANLAVINLGPSALTSQVAAYVMNELIRPASVIASHPNEGVTSGGKVRPQSRMAAFASLVKGRPVYPALSGKTMEFDGNAKCVAGC
jgi:L-ascorbate metabolism protein UlaG (beta-lactamase superfamily)